MTEHTLSQVYEIALSVRVTWQAHSLSNAGNNGSNRLLPRRQFLANGMETDACSGNIAKHHHAVLEAEYLEEAGSPLCPACQARDGRRAAALIEQAAYRNLTIEQILSGCGLCDTHGFLVTAKNAPTSRSPKTGTEEHTEARQRLSKHSLIEFSFALALPEQHTETVQLTTRSGDSKDEGQMLMKMSARSGAYALCIRYKCAGIGIDTEKWKLVVDDEQERVRRHRAILMALRDGLLSPQGALTATMLPHLTGLQGVIAICTRAGRAPIYSALHEDFMPQLLQLGSDSCTMSSFENVESFHTQMCALIEHTAPSLPAAFVAHSQPRAVTDTQR